MNIFLGKSPLYDLSFEREILEKGSDEVILLISRWKERYLILGYAQDFEGIEKDEISKNKIAVFRRSSGGTAVLSTDSINISLFIPARTNLAKPIEELYKIFLEAAKDALLKTGKDVEISKIKEKVNSPLCFLSQSGETILHNNKKIFGGAQTRNKRILLVHGTLLLDFDKDLHQKIFGIDKEILDEKIASIKIDVKSFTEQTIESFAKTFKLRYDKNPLPISPSQEFIEQTKNPKWMPR